MDILLPLQIQLASVLISITLNHFLAENNLESILSVCHSLRTMKDPLNDIKESDKWLVLCLCIIWLFK